MIFSIHPKLEELPSVLEQIEKSVQRSGAAHAVILCCEELLSNIIFYANAPADSTIEISIVEELTQLIVTIKDSGKAYNPLEKNPPDLKLDLEQREIGGLGIHLVKQMSKEQLYHFDGSYNRLTLKFSRDS